ncbi:MAG: cupredoxin domain-containing protein [Actinomycetota bacterium]
MRRLFALVALTGALSACSPEPDRSVEIAMVDNAFQPASLQVTKGETVRFVFRNAGSLAHDAVIGDEQAQQEHAETAEGGHAGHGGDALDLDPGQSGELIYTFKEAGELKIGCHEPGHYEAGMKVDLTAV